LRRSERMRRVQAQLVTFLRLLAFSAAAINKRFSRPTAHAWAAKKATSQVKDRSAAISPRGPCESMPLNEGDRSIRAYVELVNRFALIFFYYYLDCSNCRLAANSVGIMWVSIRWNDQFRVGVEGDLIFCVDSRQESTSILVILSKILSSEFCASWRRGMRELITTSNITKNIREMRMD
jgi:hypothetical protein